MEISLKGKTALVTGGATGIGRAIALALADCGADVAFTYFSHGAEAEKTAQQIGDLGRRTLALPLDATQSSAVNQVVAQVAADFGGHIDILVNNAGHLIARVLVGEMSDEHWHKVIAVNLHSMFYVTRAVLPYMNTGWGRIVNVSSLAAHNGGGRGAVAYAAAKAGMIGFTRGLAKEVGAQGITVNAVAPGLILGTAFHETFTPPEAIKSTIAAIPLGKAGTPEDVANAVLYLASDMGTFVTGEVMEMNGGIWFT